MRSSATHRLNASPPHCPSLSPHSLLNDAHCPSLPYTTPVPTRLPHPNLTDVHCPSLPQHRCTQLPHCHYTALTKPPHCHLTALTQPPHCHLTALTQPPHLSHCAISFPTLSSLPPHRLLLGGVRSFLYTQHKNVKHVYDCWCMHDASWRMYDINVTHTRL